MTEFGSLALMDEGVGDGETVAVSLPGVRKGAKGQSVVLGMSVLHRVTVL